MCINYHRHQLKKQLYLSAAKQAGSLEVNHFNPRTCRGGGVGWTPHGFSRITRVERGGSPQNLQYPRVEQFDTYCLNFKSMSCQLIKL